MNTEPVSYLPGEAPLSQAQDRLSPPLRILADEFCLRRQLSPEEARLGEFLADVCERALARGGGSWEEE